jgi:predicted RNase H-like nuclease (RuvC/YqgF family)
VSEPISSGGWVHQKLQNDITWLASELTRMKDKNARLKAEVEELKSQPDPLTAYLYADTLRRDDIKTLKAHIERLTKAGDAMASSIQFNEEMSQDYNGPAIVHQSVQRWNAAKEGKGQS